MSLQDYRGRQPAMEVRADAGRAVHFDMHEAETQLSRIIERVERGEEIIIDRAGAPVAKIIPFARHVNRTAVGSLAGRLDLSGDWDSPATNADIAADFGISSSEVFVSPVTIWEITSSRRPESWGPRTP